MVRGLEREGLAAPVDLTVRGGEILGLAGQLGSGAPNVLRAIAGAQHMVAGEVRVDGECSPGTASAGRSPPASRSAPATASCDGVFQIRTVTENLTAPALGADQPAHLALAPPRARARGRAGRLLRHRPRAPRLLRPARSRAATSRRSPSASGSRSGRACCSSRSRRAASTSVRGPRSTAHIRALADQGLAVVFASSDLPEVLGLADTVATFYRGRARADSPPASALDQAALHARRDPRRARSEGRAVIAERLAATATARRLASVDRRPARRPALDRRARWRLLLVVGGLTTPAFLTVDNMLDRRPVRVDHRHRGRRHDLHHALRATSSRCPSQQTAVLSAVTFALAFSNGWGSLPRSS